MRRLLIILPIILLSTLFALFTLMILRGEKEPAGSRIVGRDAPAFELKALNTDTQVLLSSYRGQPVIVNFFASWCAPCRVEHPALMQLSAQGVVIIGINYKDKPEAAQAFIAELGNPFVAIGQDTNGRTGIDFGITGVPETFVIGTDGRVLASWASPLTPNIIENRILPALLGPPPTAD